MQTTKALYEATIAGNPGCWMAYNNLGKLFADRGKPDEAIACCRGR